MRPAGVQFGRKYLNAYHDKFRQSEPTEDAEDRLALYALLVGSLFSQLHAILMDCICRRSRIHDSALYPMNAGFRNLYICNSLIITLTNFSQGHRTNEIVG